MDKKLTATPTRLAARKVSVHAFNHHHETPLVHP